MKIVPRLHLLLLFISASISQCLGVDYRYFVAGGVCAAYSHGITTPIDVIKTKMQADPMEYSDGMLSAAAKIIKKDGPGVLLGGLGPTVVGYGIEGAAKFGIYEILKPVFGQVIDDQPTAFILASIAAGSVAALILCPAESVRIRIVTDKNYADKGLLSGLPKLIKEEGLLEMFGGFPAMLTKQVSKLRTQFSRFVNTPVLMASIRLTNRQTLARFHILWRNKFHLISSQSCCTLSSRGWTWT